MDRHAEILAQAKACQTAGDLPAAEQHYRRALAADPLRADAHNALGAVLGQQGKFGEATASLHRALELKPDFSQAYYNLAAVAISQNRLDEAAACWRRAVQLKPDYFDAYSNLATLALNRNQLDEAAACYRRALKLKPNSAEAHNNLGAVLEKQGQLDEAAACWRRAVEVKPDFAEAYQNLGAVLLKQDKLDEAAACCRRAVELKPGDAEAHGILAAVLAKQEQLDEAIVQYRRAVELKPDFAEAHNNLGALLQKQGQLDEAIACCRRALELQPDSAEAFGNLGILLAQQGRVAEATACYLQAARLEPKQDVWRLNVLSLCPSVFNSSEDIEHFRRRLLSELNDFQFIEQDFDGAALATTACRPSFNLQFHGHNDRPVREAYARIFRDCFPNEIPQGSGGRPRIGFVVTNRHEQAFLKSMGGVLEHIDQDLFELVVMGTDQGLAKIRSEFRNPAVRLLGVPHKFDAFVEAIRDAKCDLLYYWEVATDSTNYFLPFFRLAPVQCTSWGIQVTSGIPQLDHYLSSALVEAAEARDHYTENLVLASTLLTYQQRVSIPELPKSRESFGISAERHVYLCAQQLGKFHPDFDPVLAGILRRDAQGVVVVTEDRHGGFVANQLRQRFAATMGDVAERIVFLPFQPSSDYLSLVAIADVLLDPLHFGGVNSSYDGFSLNKPIVTLPSQFQRGRYTLACYKKMGISDCVASNPRQYIDIAVALGTDAEFRDQVVEKIRQASPVLFEDMEAVREHERIFSALVEESRRCRHADQI